MRLHVPRRETLIIVERRTREIGIRIAVGATPWRIVALMLGQSLTATLVGGAAGIAIAALSARLLAAYLVGIEPGDRVAFVAAALGVTIVALFASYLPARSAVQVDPMMALRVE
jgi:ABC-type antimicrobial peptide transport system permease subunit